MLKNIWNRVISVASVLAMIAYISLPQLHIVYATYQDNKENTISLDNLDEITTTEKDVSTFEYDNEDFSLKAEINADTIFSIDDTPLNANDVQLVVSVINETNRQYQPINEKFADSTHKLLLYNIDFYTKDGKKVNVSNCDANIKLSFKEPSISCNSEEIKVIHIDDTSLDSTDVSITGTSFINNQLTDIAFHVSSFSMYGILIPSIEKDIQIEHNKFQLATYNDSSYLTIGDSSNTLNTFNAVNSSDTVNTINNFTLALESGATLNEGKYVWVADTSNEGHGFIYKITFSISGESLPPNSIEITLPKQILKDSQGNFAGDIMLPYPNEGEEYDKSIVNYVYREDGDNIIIYNIKNIQAGTLEIPFMYETTEKTWEYTDMAPSEPCVATVTIQTKDTNGGNATISAKTDEIPVYIDTSVKINSTSKAFKYIYNTWQSSWGFNEPEKPNGVEYIYIIWQVNSSITDITQKYDFKLNDIFNGLITNENDSEGEVIGYKMKESSIYVSPNNDGSSPTVEDLTASSRTDYVLTRYPKSQFEEGEEYELENTVTATVTPSDKIDNSTSATDTATYIYKEPIPVAPIYTPPVENYTISKYGIYGSKKHVNNQNQISSYSLEDLTNDKNLSGLMYHIQANAYAYIHTLPDDVDGTNEENVNQFGQKSVTYAVSDSQIFLNDSEKALTKDDYTFTSLEYNVKMQSAEYDQDTKSFIRSNVTNFNQRNVLTFYVMTEDDSEYIPVAIYKLYDKTISIDNNYVSSLTDSIISFKGNVKGWKIETSNPYYCTSFDIYPTITLKSTEDVKNAIGDASKISVSNTSVLNTFDSNRNQISTRSATGTDYVAKVQRDSKINKNFVSAKNYPGLRCYKVNWKTSISETYIDNSGTFSVRQESGVFYDLIPIGSRIDINSIKVYADGVELSEGEYIVDTTPNYKDSNRILLTVRINSPADVEYIMTYTTVHLWEDVLDYGRYVLNSVAYETGNEDIAKGYPDSGGNISDSTILENLDPDTNAKRFLYSQATHYINALIPHSSGITKKVASSNDAVFSDSTIVNQDSTYTYNIRMENSSLTKAKDIIILDSIENFCDGLNGSSDKTCDWHGTLESFGLENLTSKDIKPVVYLCTEKNIDLEQYRISSTLTSASDYASAFFYTIENDNKWIKKDDFRGDLSDVTAFAIDLRYKTNDEPFILDANESFSFTVTMRSPETVNSDDISLETYNNIYRSFISVDARDETKETYYYTHYDYTTVTYRTVGTLRFKKIGSDTNEPIQGVKFNISGTSDYGTEVNKNIVTNSNGEIYLEDLERGNYTLTETYSTSDYLPCEDKIVTVNADGTVTITTDDGTTTSANDGQTIPMIKDEPRIHGDLKFLKRSLLNINTTVIGVEFQLTGTSDYGNVIEKTATSDGYGVTFEDIELGTYTLVEISAPYDYIKSNREYTVVCNSDGILSIQGVDLSSNGYVITNTPKQEFSIRKIDAINNKKLQNAVFSLTSSSTDSSEPIKIENATSNMYGVVEFTGLDFGTYILKETTAPENHVLDTNEYTVNISLDTTTNKKVVTITNGETPLQVEEETGYFIFPNERENNGKIKIIKNWVDNSNADNSRPDDIVIHLSTNEPVVNNYKATINLNIDVKNGTQTANTKTLLRSFLTNGITKFKRDENSSIEDIEKKNYKTIGVGSKIPGADDEKDVYIYTEGDTCYYWSEAETIYLSGSASILFKDKTTITEIDLSRLNTSKVTSMYQMFQGCTKLDKINFGQSFELDNVTTMENMFYNCTALKNVNFKAFGNAPLLENTLLMFYNCQALTTINLNNFTTSSNLNTMERMFKNCSGLTTLDISKLNTSNVITMAQMFNGCSSLTSLDLSSFDTSKVGFGDVINSTTNRYEGAMFQMFLNCTQLNTINFGQSFELDNVTTMEQMFYGCKALANADFSTFGNAPLLENINWMFLDCQALTTINLENFTTSDKLTNMEKVFKNCSALTTLDISKLNTSNVNTMKEMFYGCSSLTSLDLSNFDTNNVTNMYGMFNLVSNNYTLTTVYVSNLWSTANVKNSDTMFYFCRGFVGGKGTTWLATDPKDKTYARIDGGRDSDTPGYFTYRAYPPSTTTSTTSATATKVTTFFTNISDTLRAYKAVANATLQIIPSFITVGEETTTPTDESNSNENNNPSNTTSNTTEYVSTDTTRATWTKQGDTWICEFSVFDDEAEYFVWEDPIPTGYTSNATKKNPLKVNADGSITKLQTITNTKNTVEAPKVGSLKLSKTVYQNGTPVTDNLVDFTFQITLTGDNISGERYFGTKKFTDGIATVTLKHGESITITGIPVGTAYEITEMETYGYTSTPPTNATGIITENTTAQVEWQNNIILREEKGTFHVSKNVELSEVTQKLDNTTTTKKMSLTDKEINQEFTFTAELKNLDISQKYFITQNNTILKEFTSNESGDATVEFTLKHGETVDFTDIPIGATYQITENQVDEYTPSYKLTDENSSSGETIASSSGNTSSTATETLDNDENITVAFTNTKTITVTETVKNIEVSVKKIWKNDSKTDRPKSITVYLYRGIKLITTSEDDKGNITITESVINLDICNTAILTETTDWEKVFTELPETDEQGRKYVYSVREEPIASYNSEITSTNHENGNYSFTITNTKIPTYDLSISKTVEGVLGNKAKQFEFTITLIDSSNTPLNGFYTIQRGNDEITTLFDVNGTAKIGISHGETIVIKNLPEGTKFTITETDYSTDGYTTQSSLLDDTPTDSYTVTDVLNADKTVQYINTRNGIVPTGIDSNAILLIILGILSVSMIILLKRKISH